MGKRLFKKTLLLVCAACLLCAAPAFAQGGPGLVKTLMLKSREAVTRRMSLCRVQTMKNVSYWRGPRVALERYESAAVLRSIKEIKHAAGMHPGVSEALRSQAAAFEKALQGMTPDEAHLFFYSNAFLFTDTEFALKNNRWLLEILPYYKQQLSFIKQNRKTIISSLQISKGNTSGMYARAVPAQARVILLGEVHNRPNLEREISLFLQEYRQQYPNRKMVLFTEFLPDELPGGWDPEHPVPPFYLGEDVSCVGTPLRVAASLEADIYGLEDHSFLYEKVPAEAGTVEGNYSFLAVHLRNKHWHDIMSSVMKRVRRTDPDAVFFVYAGNAHVDKSAVSSLPSMLGEEKVFTVQFSEGFEDGYLGYLLRRKPNRLAGLPQRHILRWAPGKSAFSERIGFDLHVVVPWELKNNAD